MQKTLHANGVDITISVLVTPRAANSGYKASAPKAAKAATLTKAAKQAAKRSQPLSRRPNTKHANDPLLGAYKCDCRYLRRSVLEKEAAARGFIGVKGPRAGKPSLALLSKKLALYGPRFRHGDTMIAHDSSGTKIVAPERIAQIADRLGRTPREISRPFRTPHGRCYKAIRSGTRGDKLSGLRSLGKVGTDAEAAASAAS